ncbi:hypothetical protein MMC17_004321 [Xylographa soralifera]|nr:hypothetical protein [Xylographa soralifera]
MSLLVQQEYELLNFGGSAKTNRIGDMVRKVYIIDEEEAITARNMEATRNEASIYILLGEHPRIAKYLEFYPNGPLKDYVDKHRETITDAHLKRWAVQMVEATIFIHGMGVRHSDFRLNQWLLDTDLSARLSDFNGAGYDRNAALGLEGSKALKIESSSHYLPRDPILDNTVKSDLFALGSSLYELVAGQKPYETLADEKIEALFSKEIFPSVERLLFGNVIMGCWKGKYPSAKDVLDDCENIYGV